MWTSRFTLCFLFLACWFSSSQPGLASPLPGGIKPKKDGGYAYESSSVGLDGAYIEGGRKHVNTFSVEALHEELPDGSGVRFNVETVPPALQEHLYKPKVDRDEMLDKIKGDAAAFYGDSEFPYPVSTLKDIRLEAISNAPETTVFSGGTGFVAASLTAFAQHLPLAISPDHVWVLLSHAFAKHVDQHAEELRSNFVQHGGKKRLYVEADRMVMSGGNLTVGSPAKVWEDTIFPDFSKQIKEFIGEKVHSVIASDFTTTTNTARAAHEIALMSAMKNYFSYGMSTLCGIPRITLLGSDQDWSALRARAEDLGKLMSPEVSKKWMPYLLPVLDEFVDSYRGNVNHGFWQSMVKLRNDGMGSGASDFVSGWLQILFPYLKSGEFNQRLKPWNEMYFHGPEPEDFPAIVSSAPVDWDYHGRSYKLHFHAGITGYTQDPTDGTLAPLIGWYVTHDPPQDPDVRLEVVKSEMEALLKGHEEEARAELLDKKSPWYARVRTLHLEQLSLEGPARRIVLKREAEELLRKRELGELDEDEGYETFRAIEERMMNTEEDLKGLDEDMVSTDAMIKAFFIKNGETCSGKKAGEV